MTSACQNKFLFAVTLLTLLVAANGVRWQGTGNMTSDNMTKIMSYIQNNYDGLPAKGASTAFDPVSSVQDFVSYLNHFWDPSWNVVVADTIASSDAVLYGYAFNVHWLWINNYVSGGYVFSFVIWKDFKCGGYKTVGSTGIVTKTLDETPWKAKYQQAISAFSTGYTMNIWDLASQFVTKLKTISPFSVLGDLSIVMSNDADSTKFFAKICMVSTQFTYFTFGTDNNGKGYGKALLFQTR